MTNRVKKFRLEEEAPFSHETQRQQLLTLSSSLNHHRLPYKQASILMPAPQTVTNHMLLLFHIHGPHSRRRRSRLTFSRQRPSYQQPASLAQKNRSSWQ